MRSNNAGDTLLQAPSDVRVVKPGSDAPRVTPWEVRGRIDYERLVRDFGTTPLTAETLDRLREAAGGTLHPLLRRGLFVSHRDLDWVLDEWEQGRPFAVYTGRGPSGPVHLAHLVPWRVTRWLQERFGCDVWFQLTDDEKYLFNPNLDRDETRGWAFENALDFVALGFDPDKTHVLIDTVHAETLYPRALDVAKRITVNTARSAFGFTGSSNVGQLFFTSMQAVPAFLPSDLAGEDVPVLIPHGIDQDPHFRVARDVLPRLGYPKPASVHSRLVPGLTGEESKMSASEPETALFTTDSPKTIRKKVMKHAFSGGQPTVEEHRRLGGDPDRDMAYQWLRLLEPSDERLEELSAQYRTGELLSGELKQLLVDRVNGFLEEHRERREAMRGRLAEFLFDPDTANP